MVCFAVDLNQPDTTLKRDSKLILLKIFAYNPSCYYCTSYRTQNEDAAIPLLTYIATPRYASKVR